MGPDLEATTYDLVSTSVSGAVHVSGGAHAADLVSSFGSPLLVDFVTLRASPGPHLLSPTVGGYSAGASLEEPWYGVAGAIH